VTDGLLLLHAWPVDARIWRLQVESLAHTTAVVAPHHPGFGGTRGAGPAMTMASAAERALEELDRADVDRAVVCGLSMGGYVAFELWRTARERVAGLVLANTRAVPDGEGIVKARHDLAARLRGEGIGFFLDDPPALLSDRAPEDVRRFVLELIADQGPEPIAAALLGMAERPDSTPDLAGIDVPTLVITSDLDELIPSEISLQMAASIPGATTLEIPGAGHLSNLESPEAFTGGLRELIVRCALS